jgi:hypothetical protein
LESHFWTLITDNWRLSSFFKAYIIYFKGVGISYYFIWWMKSVPNSNIFVSSMSIEIKASWHICQILSKLKFCENFWILSKLSILSNILISSFICCQYYAIHQRSKSKIPKRSFDNWKICQTQDQLTPIFVYREDWCQKYLFGIIFLNSYYRLLSIW